MSFAAAVSTESLRGGGWSMGGSNFCVLKPCAREELCAQAHPTPGPSPSNPSQPLGVPRDPHPSTGQPLLPRAGVKPRGHCLQQGNGGCLSGEGGPRHSRARSLPGFSHSMARTPVLPLLRQPGTVPCRKCHPGPIEYNPCSQGDPSLHQPEELVVRLGWPHTPPAHRGVP